MSRQVLKKTGVKKAILLSLALYRPQNSGKVIFIGSGFFSGL
jgi:hypothetical protein